jgi:hypothetical protein
MTPEAADELILRHLDGDTSAEEATQVTRLLAGDTQFRARFYLLVSQVARLREILDDRLTDSSFPRPTEVGMRAQSTAPAPRLSPRVATPQPVAPSAPQKAEWNLDFRRIYFNAVVGGTGGLIGWLVMSLAITWLGLGAINVYIRQAIVGPLIGVCIGFAVGATEGLIASRSLKRILRGGRWGAVLGAAGGFAGLVIGELIFNLAGGGVWPRALGWALFGMCVGASDGVAQQMTTKIRYGVLGGLLGGLIGGATFEGLVPVLRALGGQAVAVSWGGALGLIILAACIGFLVGLVEVLLRKSWLFFLTGRLEGQTRTLDSSRPHTIGSADTCTIVVPNDPSIQPIHAEISFADGDFLIQPRDGQVVIRRETSDLPVSGATPLQPGDRVLLGETRMVFRNVEGRKS